MQELVIDYSSCATQAQEINSTSIPSNLVQWNFKGAVKPPSASWSKQTINYTYPNGVTVYGITQCSLVFDIPADMNPPVLFYYRLTNFYQNHRRYVKSFDANQLKGNAVDNNTINSGYCDPLKLDPSGKPYYPCGLIANSLFNDTFFNPIFQNDPNGDSHATYFMNDNSNIAWDTDASLYGKTQYDPSQIAVPPNWVLRFPNGYSKATPPPDLSKDQAFQVWMRTAGLPTFSKLARRNDTTTMSAGTYRVDINQSMFSSCQIPDLYNTDASQTSPSKSMAAPKPSSSPLVLSLAAAIPSLESPTLSLAASVSFLESSSPSLISFVQGMPLCAHFRTMSPNQPLTTHHRKLGDHTYLSWNNEQPSTATTSGRDLRGASAGA